MLIVMFTATFFTIAFTLFLAIDALGVIPVYLSLVDELPRQKKLFIAIQELLFALVIMILFHFLGIPLLNLLNLTSTTIQIAGGIVIFLIAIRLVFSSEEKDLKPLQWKKTRPLIFPIATPLMAGPQVLAVIMIYSQEEQMSFVVILAILAAWFLSSILFLLASPIYKLVGEKGLNAIQRLMGLMVALIAIQMLLQGLKGIKF